MAKGYRPVRRDQPFLLPPDMRDWLPAGHRVWLLIEVVAAHLDTSAFHARRRTGGAETAGYDPDMLVTLLLWAYAQGLTSSRRIEAACWSDVAFRVICAGDVPDHATIARFRADFAGPVEELFTQVLMLCARLGMGGLGTIALDGSKIAANASKAANRTEDGLRKLAAQAVAAHARADAAIDDSPGNGADGGQLPPGVTQPGSRAARIQAALAELEAGRTAAQRGAQAKTSEYVSRTASGLGGGPPAGTEVAAARAALTREIARQKARIEVWEHQRAQARAATGKGLPGGPLAAPEQCHLARAAAARLARAEARAAEREARAAAKAARRKGPPGPVRNVTDPDSRLMPVRSGGFIQGYNAQNVTSEDKLIIATELTQDPGDTRWFEPMLRRAETAAALIARCQAVCPQPATTAPPAA
jgi:transposase